MVDRLAELGRAPWRKNGAAPRARRWRTEADRGCARQLCEAAGDVACSAFAFFPGTRMRFAGAVFAAQLVIMLDAGFEVVLVLLAHHPPELGRPAGPNLTRTDDLLR